MDYIESILKDPNYCPCLLLGRSSIDFKKAYQGRIFTVTSLEAVRDIVERYTGISDLEGRYCVLDGICFLSEVGQNSLLKFIEESRFPIVLLSYYDKVSPIIMSRVKFVFKSPTHEIKNLKFMKYKDALTALEDKQGKEELSNQDKLRFYIDNCPVAYYMDKSCIANDGVSKRINKILSGL